MNQVVDRENFRDAVHTCTSTRRPSASQQPVTLKKSFSKTAIG